MTIEYYLNHVSHSHLLMSSRIKHIIDSFFFSLTVIAIFFCKNHMWSERLRLLLQSFKLKSFYITITMDISLIYISKEKVSERIILLEFSSLKVSFTPRVKFA